MPSAAVLAFESALRRAIPDTSVTAADHFDALIKAKKKAAAPAPTPAAAPAPENPTGALGRGTGAKAGTFEHDHPHLVHGGTFKLYPQPGGSRSTPIGPSHKDWNYQGNGIDMTAAPVYKVHNPLETLNRIGHRQMKGLKPADMQGAENPNHPAHTAYLFKQTSIELHPETSQNAAFRQKKSRGTHPQIAVRNVTSGAFTGTNQYTASKDNPRTLGEEMGRIRSDAPNASKHAKHLTHRVVRAEMVTRGFNRLFDVARGMGKDFHQDMDPAALHGAALQRNLMDYSGRREVQGFHAEHLGSKHNPLSAGDVNAAGKPTHKANPFFSQKKGEAHPLGDDLKHINNFEDLATHLQSRPIGHGNMAQFKGKEHVVDYLPGEADSVLHTHARMRGIKR